jgi:hypothetical protein
MHRWCGGSAWAFVVVTSCTRNVVPTPASVCNELQTNPNAVTLSLWSIADVTGDSSHMLSGLWYDDRHHNFFSVMDNDPHVVSLQSDVSMRQWVATRENFDLSSYTQLEGITGNLTDFVITDEDDREGALHGPHVVLVSRSDGRIRNVEVPARFRELSHNSGFEAVSLVPDGQTLLVANERALLRDVDGMVRILSVNMRTQAQQQHAYSLGPNCWNDGASSDAGLSDFVAVSATHLLTVERAWRRDRGNCVRIFLTDLSSAPDVQARDTLTSDVPVARKQLVLDLSDLPRTIDLPLGPTQTHPALGNYEGIAIGPCLPDGRRSVVLVTDDNYDSVQRTGSPPQARRILVLAATGL